MGGPGGPGGGPGGGFGGGPGGPGGMGGRPGGMGGRPPSGMGGRPGGMGGPPPGGMGMGGGHRHVSYGGGCGSSVIVGIIVIFFLIVGAFTALLNSPWMLPIFIVLIVAVAAFIIYKFVKQRNDAKKEEDERMERILNTPLDEFGEGYSELNDLEDKYTGATAAAKQTTTASTRYCTSCGAPLQAGQKFCGSCGAATGTAGTPQTPGPSA